MSAYLVTREGQKLGSFEASQIQEGLQTGQFLPTDWGWREGMSGWQGLTEIFGAAPAPKTQALASSLSSLVRKPTGPKPPESINPYAAPASSIVITRTSGEVPHDVVHTFIDARPWMKFISILLGLLCVCFILSGIGNFSMFGGILRALIMWLIAACCNYPALKLSRSCKAITRLAETRSFDDLQAAAEEQRRFWKSFGIVCIIIPILLILFGMVISGGLR